MSIRSVFLGFVLISSLIGVLLLFVRVSFVGDNNDDFIITATNVFPSPDRVASSTIDTRALNCELTPSQYQDLYELLAKNTSHYSRFTKGAIICGARITTIEGQVVELLLLEGPYPTYLSTKPVSYATGLWIQIDNVYCIGVTNPQPLIDFLLKIEPGAFRYLDKFRTVILNLE